MKKLKMYISFLLFLLFTSIQVKAGDAPKAQDIPMYKKVPHLGTRTTEPGVTASLEQNQLTVEINRYVGVVNVSVYDRYNNLIASSSEFVNNKGLCYLDMSNFENGTYELMVEVENTIFYGIVEH